ncbi:DNRLRE domain-containing protein [Streptomyces kasugaensis]|uniref:DNRLRE domain-containing protein n=1 Tax=Streptomyces kasugaensis TaxID=1946 RepID=A0A4Q9I0Q2_STRKA|nr:FG-GAP-like repeat-containing protein [Streptomyces kasugaensis]TBO60955.1 DNRLRE domain-containing protein [Streptomyces kasugaensis]
MIALTAATAMLASGVTAPTAAAAPFPVNPQPSAAFPASPASAGDGSVSEEDQALQQAQSSGAPTEVTSARTESSDTWANPDGTFSVKRYGAPIRLWREGEWVASDPSLVFADDGTVVPKAANVAVVFSGGGGGPMLSGVKDGRTLTLSWPTALPKPTLKANVATYGEILPGVDLQLKAEVNGFSQLLVVRNAEAAKNPQLASLKFKLDTVGLTVSTDGETGSITAVDPAGQDVFTSPTPLMWDSTVKGGAAVKQRAAGAAAPAEAAADDAFEPAPGAKDAQMPATVTGDTLQFSPDQKLLGASDTTYPVYIDPTLSTAWGHRQNWTRVYRKYPSSSFWNAKEVARVGYENETNGLSRSFFQMDTSDVRGADVRQATFRIRNVWSWSCRAQPVEIWHTGQISRQTTWNNQPGRIGAQPLSTVNDAKGWQGSNDCPAGNLEFDTTSKVREAATKKWSSITFGMSATAGDEDRRNEFSWKKFDPKTATLEIRYNHPPKVPYALGTNPKTSCDGGGLIGNTRVSLFATVDDQDAGNLTAQFQVFKSDSTTPVLDQSLSAMKQRSVTLPLPDSTVPSGSYQWKVRAKDAQGAYSSWSRTCAFSVDRERPSKPPTVGSAEFPNGENGWPAGTGKARTVGHLNLSPNGATDVVQYGWYSDYDPEVKYIDVATAAASPPTFKPPGYGPHFIYAFSIDKAKNRSDTATYVYYAARSAERDGPDDLNGDMNNDIWSVDSNGTLLTYAGQGNSQFSTATNGGQSFDGGKVASRGDWGGDGYNDLIALEYNAADKRNQLWIYPNNGTGIASPDRKHPLTVACPDKQPGSDDDPDGCSAGDDHWSDADQIIAPGDLNGDGMPDLLVKQGKLLWAYYGNRSEFLDRVGAPVLVGGKDWNKYTVIAPGDLNGDGFADLWLRDDATGDLWCAYGKQGERKGVLDPATWGTASLVKVSSGLSAHTYPVLGSSGDVTGDGIPDLWARKADNTMTGWPGKKTGRDFTGFASAFTIDGIVGGSRIPAGTRLNPGDSFTSRSAKLTMQDDGDLAVISNAGKTLWSTKTAGNPGSTALMQADGNLVVYKPDGSTKTWESQTKAPGGYALLQDRGNLVVYNVKSQSQWSSGTAIRHDYNGDGRSDMAAWYDYPDRHDALHTFLTNSDGTFQPPFSSYSSAVDSWNVQNMQFATGDYNGDGRGDMAVLYNYGGGKVKVFTALGKPDGGFSAPFSSWSAPAGSWYAEHITLHSGDFNGDGRDDLAFWYAYSDGSDVLFTLTADVRGGFNHPFGSLTQPAGWWDVAQSKFVTGDFNGDGRDDLAALYGYPDGSVKMHTFLTAPTGGFTPGIQSWGSTVTGWGDWNRTYLQAGDFDGDGKDDVVAWYDYADGHDALHTLISKGTGDGGFNKPVQSWNSAAGNWYYPHMKIVAGDYDGDGRDDLGAMYGYADGTVRMFTWTATPTGGFNFAVPSWSTPSGWTFSNVFMLNRYN